MPAPTASAIFISYAREDTDAARRMADALRSSGLEVWFDQNELRGGDTWDQKIRRQIKDCGLFIPLISANTQERKEGYFRLEWKLAAERTHLMAEGVPFIAPIVVDATTEGSAIVPAEFMRVQWTRLPGALATPEFIEQIKRLLGGSASPLPAPRVESAAARSTHSPAAVAPKAKFPVALVAGLGVAVLVLVGYIALRPAAKISAPTATPAPAVAETKATPPPAPAASKILNKSIAVLPLSNMSEDKDTGFFADGVHEDLLTNLALVSELKVVSRTSVMQYRGTTKTMKQIGEELGVAYVLEGSVRRSGNKVRVTGQLINTRTDEHVWAKSYDRDLTDIFSIQAELSKEIAGALSAAISPETKKFLERKPTENPVAYDDFLKGRDVRNRAPTASQAALAQSEKLFQSAVAQDPKFAAAWGELAVVHALNVFWDRDASAERKALGDAAIARAVSLAPDALDVIRSVGTYAYYAYRDYDRATAEYGKLAKLQPNDPTVFSSLGLILRRQGRWAEALANQRRAIELDPANISYNRSLLSTLNYVRRWDEALVQQRRLVALLPGELREELALADQAISGKVSFKEVDDLLARLTPAQKDTPIAIYRRKFWAMARDDYAEFKRLDQQQPSLPEEDPPVLNAVVAAFMHRAHGEEAAARVRVEPFRSEMQALVQKEPGNVRAHGYLAAIEALLGHSADAVRLARGIVDTLPVSRDALDGPQCIYWLAEVYALTGDKDRSIAELTKLAHLPCNFAPVWWGADPAFHTLVGDPRFEALVNDPKNNAPLF
jgi:TolB-like protein/cytochrome c-type biogenesis protein CcmH/NrfG